MKDFNCILCKYKNNQEKCKESILNDNHCPTLTNIYYGKIIKYQPFKTIQKIRDKIADYKNDKYYDTFNEDCTENEDFKFIFGVISYDDLSSNVPNLLTMNDLDVIYNKKTNTYSWSIEYLYFFENTEGKKKYIERLLNCFTKFMKEHNYNTELDGFYYLFGNSIGFNTIEECYAHFKCCAIGYINS